MGAKEWDGQLDFEGAIFTYSLVSSLIKRQGLIPQKTGRSIGK